MSESSLTTVGAERKLVGGYRSRRSSESARGLQQKVTRIPQIPVGSWVVVMRQHPTLGGKVLQVKALTCIISDASGAARWSIQLVSGPCVPCELIARLATAAEVMREACHAR